MIYILGVLFAFENIFLLYKYRVKFLQKGRALLTRCKTPVADVNFYDEDDSWYLSQSPLLILRGASGGKVQ